MSSKQILIDYLRGKPKDDADVALACNDLEKELLIQIFKSGTMDRRVVKNVLTVPAPQGRDAASYLEKNNALPPWLLSLIMQILGSLLGGVLKPKESPMEPISHQLAMKDRVKEYKAKL